MASARSSCSFVCLFRKKVFVLQFSQLKRGIRVYDAEFLLIPVIIAPIDAYMCYSKVVI